MIYSDAVPSDYFYIVSSGTAAVKSASSGTLLTKLTAGGHFGERNLRKLTPEEKAKKKPVQVRGWRGRRGHMWVCCLGMFPCHIVRGLQLMYKHLPVGNPLGFRVAAPELRP
jgi:hypothetical protein